MCFVHEPVRMQYITTICISLSNDLQILAKKCSSEVTTRSKCNSYHEWSTSPGEGKTGSEEGILAQDAQLCASDAHYQLLEGMLPGIQLDHLHAIQDLVDQLDPRVLLLHLKNLRRDKSKRHMYDV